MHPFKSSLGVVLVWILVAATASLGCPAPTSTPDAEAGDGEGNSARTTSGAADEGDAASAPDFVLTAIGGDEVRLSDLSGKVRLVDFWATWCAPCRDEIPFLNELQASYGQRGFQVLAISDEDPDVIREFVDEYGVEYLNLIGTAEVAEEYGVLGLPAAYLLDGEGRVVETFLGPKPAKILSRKIEALLDQAPST